MSASKSILHWFSGTSRPTSKSPTGCTVVKDDGTTYDVTFTNWADRTRVANDFGHVVGSVTYLPAVGEWSGTFESPFNRGHTLWMAKGAYASAQGAVAALLAAREAFRAKEQAVRDDPAAWLDRELGHYDWYAHMSDDDSVYRESEAHWRNVIQPLKARVAPEVWDAIFTKHAPPECRAMGGAS